MKNSYPKHPTSNYITRPSFMLVLYAALDAGSYKFARQAALNWLAVYPGDLGVSILLARALAGEGKMTQAAATLERVCAQDPEAGEAWLDLLRIMQASDLAIETILPVTIELAAGCAFVLGKQLPKESPLPAWAESLKQAYLALGLEEYSVASELLNKTLSVNPDIPLAAVTHLRLTANTSDELTLYRLAGLYHTRWPDCLQFALCLAQSRIAVDDEPGAVSLLHQCVSNDSVGVVAERIWGRNHRYRALWPGSLEIILDLPIPADVAGRLGWNQLGAGFDLQITANDIVDADEADDQAVSGLPENAAPDFGTISDTSSSALPEGGGEASFEMVENLPDETAELDSAPSGVRFEAVEDDQVVAQEPGVSDGPSSKVEENLSSDGLDAMINGLMERILRVRAEAGIEDISEAGAPVEIDQPENTVDDLLFSTPNTAAENLSPASSTERPNEENKQAVMPSPASRPINKVAEPKRRKSKEVQDFELEIERLAKKVKKSGIARADGRFPLYVIFSTKAGLVRQYGMQTAMLIINEMKSLAEIVMKRPGWGSMVFLPDDLESIGAYGMQVIDSIDPWKLKLSLADLDKRLAKKGAMIGAVLIVGGPQVLPFHKLPNPTDDSDTQIASDNPYATLDSNYFIPEWPVGRLPGEHGQDAGLLLEQMRQVKEFHQQFRREDAWWKRMFYFFQRIRSMRKTMRPKLKKGRGNFGYTAAVWRRSSLAVYRPVGEGRSMLVSPPDYSGSFAPKKITDSTLSYYNLHGLADSNEWYGQRDVNDPSAGPDYPVAICTRDLVRNGSAPEVVFTEACYGAMIENKTEDQAMALKFLSIGVKGLAGSTCIAYGSVQSPLIGADLLGYLFWKNLREGYTIGESITKAKVELAREMHRRQGFLDGEDQKTLISFILLGDPLMKVSSTSKSKKVLRSVNHPAIKMVSDKVDGDDRTARVTAVSRDTLREVKQLVETYLPGLEDAEITISQEHEVTSEGEPVVPLAETGQKTADPNSQSRTVVMISKQVKVQARMHRHFARATVDASGKIVKLAISR